MGISTDEAHRMKDSRKPWIQNVYPLIDKGISREDCQEWLKRNSFPPAPRSSCTFCPFHSDQEWMRLRAEEPKEFAGAVEWVRRFQATAWPLLGIYGFEGKDCTFGWSQDSVSMAAGELVPQSQRAGCGGTNRSGWASVSRFFLITSSSVEVARIFGQTD
jgi:hypothetical protein